uniref:Uncharacterized protein n=1 Tax=Nelumbo nucifera TaxID=4432 RepID=A0A822YDS3_NELNU|nr:TPA_asm: hypothetical protein HUJ06_009363 [Nelumbo nucifera]
MVFHLPAIQSDHCPILVDTKGDVKPGKKFFKFEAMWLRDSNCREVVKRAWDEHSIGGDVGRGLSGVRKSLSRWNKTEFGNIFNHMRRIQSEIDSLQQLDHSPHTAGMLQSLYLQLQELQHKEELFWMQRSRESWLRLGDKNTHYFHLNAVQHRKRSSIDGLKRADGSWTYEKNEIRNMFVEHFSNFFHTSSQTVAPEILALLQPIVTTQDNEDLSRLPSKDEIESAIMQMGPFKAPGSYGICFVLSKVLGFGW